MKDENKSKEKSRTDNESQFKQKSNRLKHKVADREELWLYVSRFDWN